MSTPNHRGRGSGPKKTGAAAINHAAEIKQALELRGQGMTIPDIAKHFGVHRVTAWKWVTTALEDLRARSRELAGEWLTKELEKLDALEAHFWDTALTDQKSFENVLSIMDRRARYIGLHAPAKAETTLTQTSVAVSLQETRQAILQDPEYVEYLRQRSLNRLAGVVRGDSEPRALAVGEAPGIPGPSLNGHSNGGH